MNIPEYIKLAKQILKEDAGSEGMQYIIKAKSGLKGIETDKFKIEEVSTDNGVMSGKLSFVYPHDYGFALQVIKESMPELNVIGLELVY